MSASASQPLSRLHSFKFAVVKKAVPSTAQLLPVGKDTAPYLCGVHEPFPQPWEQTVPVMLSVVIGLGTRLDVRMRTRLKMVLYKQALDGQISFTLCV